jgi:hypothetical protein
VIREECGVKEDVVNKIKNNMLRWFGHVERMDETRLTKAFYEADMLERENLGEHFLTSEGSFREGPGQEYPKPSSLYEEFDDSERSETCV